MNLSQPHIISRLVLGLLDLSSQQMLWLLDIIIASLGQRTILSGSLLPITYLSPRAFMPLSYLRFTIILKANIQRPIRLRSYLYHREPPSFNTNYRRSDKELCYTCRCPRFHRSYSALLLSYSLFPTTGFVTMPCRWHIWPQNISYQWHAF